MTSPLKILMLEDDPTDAEIVQWSLNDAFPCQFQVVANKEAYFSALEEFRPDLVLADNALPRFSAREALEELNQRSPGIPFIMVTGTVSEEFAASIIRQGADDYILKDRLARLPSAIKSAIGRKRSETAIRQSEEVRRLIMNAALDAIICIDPDGIVTVWNPKAERMFGWQESEMLGRLLEETIIPEKYREAHRNGMNRYRETGVGQLINRPTEITALHRSGREFPIELSIVPVKNGKEEFFCAFIRDITDRKKAQEKLSRSYEEIRRLASHLQDVREEERLIIAREIHDQLGQQLTIMKMDISWLKKRLDLRDNELASEKIESLHSNIDDTIKTVRKIAADLRPGLLDDLGLGPAIEWHINEFEKRTGIEVDYEGLNEEIELSMAYKTGLFRIVQEALTNIARYASARHVTVRLQKEDEQLSLMIRDNGIGFDKEKVYAKKTYGIVGMRERTAMMGGKYHLETTPGMGTTILVQVPLVPRMAT